MRHGCRGVGGGVESDGEHGHKKCSGDGGMLFPLLHSRLVITVWHRPVVLPAVATMTAATVAGEI